jgi:hypothetical protein
MRKNTLSLSALFLCLAGSASADAIIYDVTINTSSIAGTEGSLDFNFNPGPLLTQDASLQILMFTSDGTLAGGPTLTGDVSGVLPETLTFDNLMAFNDYFGGFTYGSTISFDVSLFGPALSAPNGTATSGSTFAFSMFSDPAGTMPVLTSDTTDGFAFTIGVDLDGTTTVNNYSSETTIQAAGAATPEPSGLLLVGTVFLFAVARQCARRTARR